MQEIIDNVRQNINIKSFQSMAWAYPIAFELEKHDYILAIKWALECIQIYGLEVNPVQLDRLDKYIKDLDSGNTLTAAECQKIGQEIWYLPDREEIQTAMSNLWSAIACFKDGNGKMGARLSGVAVELVLPYLSDRRLLERYLEVAMKIHKQSMN